MIQSVYKPKRRVKGQAKTGRLYRGKFRFEPSEPIQYVGLRTQDKRIAQKRLADIVAAQERERASLVPKRPLRENAGRPLRDHLADFVRDLRTKERSEEYVRRIEQRVNKLLRLCSWQFMRDIQPDDFVQWRNEAKGLMPKTLNEYLAAINGLLNWMERQGRIEGNPLERIERVNARGRQSFVRRAFTMGELAALLRVAGKRAVVYLMAATTGLRRGELRQLVWGDLDLDGPAPVVTLRAATTKNRRSQSLPLTDELACELRSLRGTSCSGRARVFRRLVPRRETVKKDLERAGISILDDCGRKVDFHALRMTFCTMLAEEGVGERVRQELMRHRDARLTNQTYTDPARLQLAEAVRLLPPLLGEGAQIGAQESDSQRHEVAYAGTSREGTVERKCLPHKGERLGGARGDTTSHDGQNNGGGGNRTSRPKCATLADTRT